MIEMTARQLHDYLGSTNSVPLLLDVREQWEFEYCHIKNSILIPMGEINQKLHELETPQQIVVICHHGIRSRQIARFLETQNFTNIINLTGGVAAWAESVDPSMPCY